MIIYKFLKSFFLPQKLRFYEWWKSLKNHFSLKRKKSSMILWYISLQDLERVKKISRKQFKNEMHLK